MARKTKVDFSGVESYNIPGEGKKHVRIMKVEEATSQGGNDVLKFTFEVVKGEDKGCRIIESFSLAENALWKLKSLLQALGMKCDKKVTLDLDKLEGKELVIEVKHEEYNGTTRAKSNTFFKVGADSDEDEDDDDEEEDEDDEEEDEEEEEKPKKSSKKSKKDDKKPSKKSKKSEPEEDEDEDDDWDDEDDEEDEKPAKSSKKSKKENKKADKKSSKKSKKVEDEDEEDDDDDWEDD